MSRISTENLLKLSDYIREGTRTRILRFALVPLLSIYLLLSLYEIATWAIASSVYDLENLGLESVSGIILFIAAALFLYRSLRHRLAFERFFNTNTFWPILSFTIFIFTQILSDNASFNANIIANSVGNVSLALALYGSVIHAGRYAEAISPFAKTIDRNVPVWVLLLFLVLIFRLALFQSSWSFKHYMEDLSRNEIGFRPYDLIRMMSYCDGNTRRSTDYLIVGSSQSDAVFGRFDDAHDEVNRIFVAGFGPSDFYLNSNEIFRRNPRTIILYLSDFDLGRDLIPAWMKMSPFMPSCYSSVWKIISEYKGSTFATKLVGGMLLYDLFPEHKYRFIFNGYFNKLIGKNEAPTIVDESWKSQMLDSLAALDESFFDVQLAFLKKFIEKADSNGIEIVIAQGHYKPEAFTDNNKRLNRLAAKRLALLANEFDSVRYIARADVLEFTDDDYSDAYHVKLDRGLAYSEALFSMLGTH